MASVATRVPTFCHREKLLGIESRLNSLFYERESIAHGITCGLISRNHLFMLGLPGVAKTELAESLTTCIFGARFQFVQFNKDTKSENLFGPLDLAELKAGRYVHRTELTLADAHIWNLDEIWKGNIAITNKLLRPLNERRFQNGTQELSLPLEFAVLTSNELPEDMTEQQAIWDRCSIRYVALPIRDPRNFQAMLRSRIEKRRGGGISLNSVLTLDELHAAQADIVWVDAEPIIDRLTDIWRAMSALKIYVSARKYNTAVAVMQAAAWLDGRSVCDTQDFEMLIPILWDRAEQIPQIRKAIMEISDPTSAEAQDARDKAADVFEKTRQTYAQYGKTDRNKVTAQGTESMAKLEAEVARLEKTIRFCNHAGKNVNVMQEYLREVEAWKEEVMRVCLLGKAPTMM